MLRNLDTIYDIARSSKNFSTGINFSENFFLVYRGSVDYTREISKIGIESQEATGFGRTSRYSCKNATRDD